MWLYCPKCNNQKDVGKKSRYNVFLCDYCKHKFRGIQAKPNIMWGHATALLWNFVPFATHYEDFESTPCPHCRQAVCYRGGWPSVCCECARDLPTGDVNEIVA